MLGGVAVLLLLHLVDPDQPVLRGERLLQVLQLDVLVADLRVAGAVEARRRAEVQLREREGESEREREKQTEKKVKLSGRKLPTSCVFLATDESQAEH